MEPIKPRGGPKAPRRPRVADRLELQQQVTELAAQQAAMSEVLRSIANSPHELDPIFDTITANAARLCRAEVGALILFEEHGLRFVARTGVADGYYVKGHLYPVSEGAPFARMIKTRSPVHIADLATDQAYLQRVPGVVAIVERIGVRSYLLVPMLKDDELVGGISAPACSNSRTSKLSWSRPLPRKLLSHWRLHVRCRWSWHTRLAS